MTNQMVYYVDGITLTSGGVTNILGTSEDMITNSNLDLSYDLGMGEPMDSTNTPKSSVLSSMWGIIGISVLVLLIGIGVGITLAKLKIKKGFDLYED